jgi:hypothetical protein
MVDHLSPTCEVQATDTVPLFPTTVPLFPTTRHTTRVLDISEKIAVVDICQYVFVRHEIKVEKHLGVVVCLD